MRVALVHELLTRRGGAERLLKVAAGMFPDAPIYTLLYDEEKLGDWFPCERIRPSRLQKFAKVSMNHHLYLPFFPRAVESWDFSDFDFVISFSSAFAHGIRTSGNTKHLCYVNSPARYLWDRTHEVLSRSRSGLFGILRRTYAEHLFHRLRMWDAETSSRPDMLLAASKEIQRRIELYWRRENTVLYPPVDDFWFSQDVEPPHSEQKDYFLIVSQLVPYKRIELAIEACNKIGAQLRIAGEGTERRRLERIAGSTVKFLGYRGNEKLRELYKEACATIFPGEEDFGLVPLESMACGTPVIAYAKGGALETVVAGETGEFFQEPKAESLAEVLQIFEKGKYQLSSCRKRAQEFSRENFERGLHLAIKSL